MSSTLLEKFLPKNFKSSGYFMGSGFGESDTETVAENIVTNQEKVNPEAWTPFTWEDYVSQCNHKVTGGEEKILDTMVTGGYPTPHTTRSIRAGYLQKEGETYIITEMFINAIKKFADIE